MAWRSSGRSRRATSSAGGSRRSDLALVLGEEAADVGQLEGLQDRSLLLTRQEELEAAPNEGVRRLPTPREALKVGARECDGVAALASVVGDLDLAEPAVSRGGAA